MTTKTIRLRVVLSTELGRGHSTKRFHGESIELFTVYPHVKLSGYMVGLVGPCHQRNRHEDVKVRHFDTAFLFCSL